MDTKPIPDQTTSLLTTSIALYEDLAREIKCIRKSGIEIPDEIQSCYEITLHYISRLDTLIRHHPFSCLLDEILFFKKIKPQFSGDIEFYTYYYHAELFKHTVDDHSPPELELYLQRQLQRRSKFQREHPVFYQYMLEGRKDQDQHWFTRTKQDPCNCPYAKPLAIWNGLFKYEALVEEQLRQIRATLIPPGTETKIKTEP